MKALNDLVYMTNRHIRGLLREPFYIAFTLAQPTVWLLLFGQLMSKVAFLPNFGATSYASFVVPGVVVMTALFSGGCNGLSMIMDVDRGVMDRFLVSPVSRFALLAGPILALALVTFIQTMVLVVLGLAMGAHYASGGVGVVGMMLSAVLLAAPFAALSNAMALVVRKQEAVIGASNFILLPLTFLSPVFMATSLMPNWMAFAARFNPVTWSVQAARATLSLTPDWTLVLSRFSLLAVLAVLTFWLAIRTFKTYQRST